MPIATSLNLSVVDYKDANHWYWRLTDAAGHFLADQEVNLNPKDSEYEGFLDLPAHLAIQAAPDRRREDEARLVRQVGVWMGCHFYGGIGGPLLWLKRTGEARSLLYECLAIFESAGGTMELGLIHSAIALFEAELRHFPQAVRHESVAISYHYSALLPDASAKSHLNLANHLTRASADARLAQAHHLASAIIFYQTNDGDLPRALQALRGDLARASPIDPPATFDELCRLVEQTDGVRFRELFSRLPQRAASGDEALRTVFEMARAAKSEPEIPEPIRLLLEAAASGQNIEPMLAAIREQLADSPQADEIMAGLRAMIDRAKAAKSGE